MIDVNQSMLGFIRRAVKSEDEEKVIFYNTRYTARQIFDDVERIGTFLRKNGVKKGDSVIICLPNIVQAVTSLYAINSVGAVSNVVHPKIGTNALIRVAQETNTKWIFIYKKFYKIHKTALIKNGVKAVVCTGVEGFNQKRKEIQGYEVGGNSVSYSKTLVKAEPNDGIYLGEDRAVYLHSSGTTGEPKTVVLSNRAMNALITGIHDLVQPIAGSAMLMTLPIFHGFGLGVCVHLMMMFGKIDLLPVFTAKKAVKRINSSEIGYLPVVPNMLRKMIARKDFDSTALRSIHNIFVGGDKLDESLRKQTCKILEKNGSKCKVCEGFGLSETASVTHVNVDCKDGETVGRPITGVKVKIMDNGVDVGVNKDGIIYISSPTMMDGYLTGKPPFEYDENGTKWLNTGDIGRLDEQGYLYYKGRAKRMLKIGGVNIFPQEIESVANSVPEVKNSCAVRIVHNGKPAVKLLVVLKDKEKLTAGLIKKITSEISAHIMPYAEPRVIEQRTELKLTGMGKTDYRYYEENNK